jgi:hypothetical protein
VEKKYKVLDFHQTNMSESKRAGSNFEITVKNGGCQVEIDSYRESELR